MELVLLFAQFPSPAVLKYLHTSKLQLSPSHLQKESSQTGIFTRTITSSNLVVALVRIHQHLLQSFPGVGVRERMHPLLENASAFSANPFPGSKGGHGLAHA